MNTEQITELEKQAEANNGKCSHCHQTIKIYRYRLNKSHAQFLRAMANEIRNTGDNDVDISTIGLSYSVRTQVTKMRLHGLIARIKGDEGAQIPRRWLITHKGWSWLNGDPVDEKVVVYNNQVLGHDGNRVTIYEMLDERFDPHEPVYTETPVSEPEARVYADVRQDKAHSDLKAKFVGYGAGLTQGTIYDIEIEKLRVGKPVKMLKPHQRVYKSIADFNREWSIV